MHHHSRSPSPSDYSRGSLPGFWGIALDTASRYGEVLLRTSFGERHLTLMGVLFGMAGLLFLPVVLITVVTFMLSSFLLGSMAGLFAAFMSIQFPWAKGTIYFQSFVLFFLGKSCFLFIEMEYRRRAGKQVSSVYSGKPNALWKLVPGFGTNEDAVKRFGEPLVLMALALWIRHSDLLLTIYLGVSSAAMFVKGHFEHWLIHQELLDVNDQLLKGQALGGHLRGYSNQPGDLRGVALPAALASYPEEQARAISSNLQANCPMIPAPGGPQYLNLGSSATSLPPEFARLVTPSATAALVEDWFVDDASPPESNDWFENVTPAESNNEFSVKTAPVKSKVGYRCPICDAKYRVQPDHVGKRARCKRCGDQFRVPPIDKF